jgi:hypothetical protein
LTSLAIKGKIKETTFPRRNDYAASTFHPYREAQVGADHPFLWLVA